VGEYSLSVLTGSKTVLRVALDDGAEISLYSGPFATNGASVDLYTSNAPLDMEVNFSELSEVTIESPLVSDLWLFHEDFRGEWKDISTILGAEVRFKRIRELTRNLERDGRLITDSAVGTLTGLRLVESGVAFTFTGSVSGATVGIEKIDLPNKFQWLLGVRLLHVLAGAFTYVVVGLLGLLLWSRDHVPIAKPY
jgi:hypothetical protein